MNKSFNHSKRNLWIWSITYICIFLGGLFLGLFSLPPRPMVILTSDENLVPESLITTTNKILQIQLKITVCKEASCFYQNISKADFYLINKKWIKEFRSSELLEIRSPDFIVNSNFLSTTPLPDQAIPWIWRHDSNSKTIQVFYFLIKNSQKFKFSNDDKISLFNVGLDQLWPIKKFQIEILKFLSSEPSIFLWTKFTDFKSCLEFNSALIPTNKKPEALKDIPLKDLSFLD